MESLALKLRPNKLSDVLGQKHLIGNNKVLTNLVKNKKIFSMILYGKPGIGKTTIAHALVNELNINYRMLNAVLNNKKDFDTVIEEALMYGELILIIDEIHRMNKDKQDLLLPRIESGLITLIGLTSSNPYHSINPAIRSRVHLFKLEDLDDEDIKKGLIKALKHETLKGIIIDNNAIDYIVSLSGGDLRVAYNTLEMAYYSLNKNITIDLLKELNFKANFFHDKNEDGYYDVLSAFQKSIRGSDPHASLHYLARLIIAGDFDAIYRRMSVIAYEDIGLANPSIGPKVMAAINASERLGMPESAICLGTIVIEMALSPKSNTGCLAINSALNDIETKPIGNIPNHMRSPYKGYLYPHNYKNGFVKQQYLPYQLKDTKYYIPKDNSKYEKALKEFMEKLEALSK